jgi:enolase-phosphatase E1
MRRPRAILTDIEGTTTRIAYVRDVLFPYARARLAGFLAHAAGQPEVEAVLAETRRLAPHQPPLESLIAWMDADAKITPLKTLQGLIWHQGYLAGALHGELYPDVAPALRRWHEAGIRLEVYSSGSAAAQQLLFGYSSAGDLGRLFAAFNDTGIGAKRDPASYRRIAEASRITAADWLFLSDMAAELDAAHLAGLQTCQLVRPEDGTAPAGNHAHAADFDTVEGLWHPAPPGGAHSAN